ncbi:hypothetical protein [Pseudomonas sp. AU12215]|uniref:hypothetical protein n=1 Tax=Pseudomonas sp. AU12215 TaxID=1860123 RepID=UPI0007EE8A7D|nr:hypothetical protein [Pseudomonas sp. AU12215]OBY48670.1 hypothetical protein A9513_032810 [Pseudomonas sp. AU12215]
MTTNVYDKNTLKAGTDSRWSMTKEFAFFFVDNSGFEKIVATENAIFVFAGDSLVIQQWKDFLFSEHTALEQPNLDGIAMLMVDKTTGDVIFSHGQDIQPADEESRVVASFAGSGARHAAGCWMQNRDVVRSINTAKLFDLYSGGDTKYFELQANNGNLTEDVGLAGLNRAFMERGMVMYLANGQAPMSIRDAAAQDDRVKELVDGIAKGSLSLSAPCDAQFIKPTQEDKDRLKAALDLVMRR